MNYSLKNKADKLTTDLQETPDPIELVQMRARYEELEKHNETLKAELEKASQDKEDLKETHKITWSRFKHSSIKRQLKHRELKSPSGNFGNLGTSVYL